MAYKLIITDTTHSDLNDTLNYIVNHLTNPNTAAHVAQRDEVL